MHLTLKFLGEIEEEMIPRIGEQIGRACVGQGPFPLHLCGTGLFPGGRNPRVLWAGIREGMEEVVRIFRALDPLLEEIGFLREKRAFHPHVTLGRIKFLKDRRYFLAEVDGKKDADLGVMTVEAVHLIESRLRPEGAEYRDRYVVPLGAENPDAPDV